MRSMPHCRTRSDPLSAVVNRPAVNMPGTKKRRRSGGPQTATVGLLASAILACSVAFAPLLLSSEQFALMASMAYLFGTVFTVPQTHDMVSQLLSPSQPKNISDFIVLAILGLHILTFILLPSSARKPVFAVVFLFWRACYNGGIGYLLHVQSHHKRLVCWARRSHIFDDPATGRNPHPTLYRILKREMETKIPTDYRFEDAPIEYNTWLVFRRLVDLILMCDFVSYCLFAIACGKQPAQESVLMTSARWAAGWALVGFNLWVKLDAHRVVKDFAWYWGDFFYLIEQELTFDGVFEMAPHPMYSVGYAGYYGISLMAASYSVLFISILAHAAQFTFLYFVEDPHIEKTYNPPPTRTRPASPPPDDASSSEDEESPKSHADDATAPSAPEVQPWPVHNLLGLRSTDLRRVTDVAVILLQFYMLALTASTPSTPSYQALFIAHAALWRLWFSGGLGLILYRQSRWKTWTRHYLKFGESTGEAWRQWKGMYHLSLTMCYASFLAASWKMYTVPDDWRSQMALLKHVVGAMLVALQVWTAVSIYQTLGEFGWFFGDFFYVDHAPKLTYGGIYRYLNNPERVIGVAGVWGAALITRSAAVFGLALFSHVMMLCFIDFVERPHMQRLYGREIRREAGLVRSLKRSLPPQWKQIQGSVDRVLLEAVDFVEEFIDSATPKLTAGVGSFVKDTKTMFRQYPARITLTRLAPDLAGYNPRDYSVEVTGTPSPGALVAGQTHGRNEDDGQVPPERRSGFNTLAFEYGTPIKVKWTAPLHHGKKDWIGLYKVADNLSREVTQVASAGRWIATNEGAYDLGTATQGLVASNVRISTADRKDAFSGEMVFAGNKLWWTLGVFEFRYHHDGRYNVMAISQPFEIHISRFDLDNAEMDSDGSIKEAVESALLPVVQNCLDQDPNIAPSTVDEAYGSLIERDSKYANRIVFAVHHM